MKLNPAISRRGMTKIEVLVVIALIAVLAAMLLPALAMAKRKSSRVGCSSNLKQIGLSFKTWSLDNNDKYPMQVSVTNDGTMELIANGNAFVHFQVMSNEISATKIVTCANDVARTHAISFADLNNQNVSYFVGVDATPTMTNSAAFLAGDRNLSLNDAPVNPGLVSFTPNFVAGWTKQIHNKQGNVLLSDGSVQQWNSTRLDEAMKHTGMATNRLAIP
jgi:prepilin-type N-terminal cleavage/methylation domain-containing protein